MNDDRFFDLPDIFMAGEPEDKRLCVSIVSELFRDTREAISNWVRKQNKK